MIPFQYKRAQLAVLEIASCAFFAISEYSWQKNLNQWLQKLKDLSGFKGNSISGRLFSGGEDNGYEETERIYI